MISECFLLVLLLALLYLECALVSVVCSYLVVCFGLVFFALHYVCWGGGVRLVVLKARSSSFLVTFLFGSFDICLVCCRTGCMGHI